MAQLDAQKEQAKPDHAAYLEQMKQQGSKRSQELESATKIQVADQCSERADAASLSAQIAAANTVTGELSDNETSEPAENPLSQLVQMHGELMAHLAKPKMIIRGPDGRAQGPIMALAYAVSVRNSALDTITTGAGASALLRIYDGTRPATGGAATTLLCGTDVQCYVRTRCFGVLTLNAITQDSSANATGTATWFRIVKADGTTHVMDGNVGTSGSDLNLTTTSIVSGQPVSVTSFVITEGNP